MKKDFIVEYYTEDEIKDLIMKKEHLYYLDNGMEEVMIREKDIPDAIVSLNRNIYPMDLKFYDTQDIHFSTAITTCGEFLNKINPDLREKIIKRLVKLQTTSTKPRAFKVVDEEMYDSIKSELTEKHKYKGKIKVTYDDLNESLEELDTEYREALAGAVVNLNLISDYPLKLEYGTYEQREEIDRFYSMPLKPKDLKNIINYISEQMKNDFQYNLYKPIESYYLNKVKEMEQEVRKMKNKEAR